MLVWNDSTSEWVVRVESTGKGGIEGLNDGGEVGGSMKIMWFVGIEIEV